MAGEHSPYLTRFTPIDFRIYLFIQKILEIKTSESQKSRTKTLLCSARPGSGLRCNAQYELAHGRIRCDDYDGCELRHRSRHSASIGVWI